MVGGVHQEPAWEPACSGGMQGAGQPSSSGRRGDPVYSRLGNPLSPFLHLPPLVPGKSFPHSHLDPPSPVPHHLSLHTDGAAPTTLQEGGVGRRVCVWDSRQPAACNWILFASSRCTVPGSPLRSLAELAPAQSSDLCLSEPWLIFAQFAGCGAPPLWDISLAPGCPVP